MKCKKEDGSKEARGGGKGREGLAAGFNGGLGEEGDFLLGRF